MVRYCLFFTSKERKERKYKKREEASEREKDNHREKVKKGKQVWSDFYPSPVGVDRINLFRSGTTLKIRRRTPQPRLRCLVMAAFGCSARMGAFMAEVWHALAAGSA